MVVGVLVLVPVRDASFWVGSGWKVTSLFQVWFVTKLAVARSPRQVMRLTLVEIESTMIAVTTGITVGLFAKCWCTFLEPGRMWPRPRSDFSATIYMQEVWFQCSTLLPN